MKIDFEEVTPPEPPMSWEQYRRIVAAKWSEMLRGTDSLSERAFQLFLEQHPCMLPLVGAGHHGLFPSAVISQPKLPSLDGAIPDFLIISSNSEVIYAQFIEIEAPSKPWATRSGRPTVEFRQASDQIQSWKAWFTNPANVLQFQRNYQLPGYGGRTFVPQYVLIYGRRSDATLTDAVTRKRFNSRPDDEIVMTYDRLRPHEDLASALTVKVGRNGYRAISIPPTVGLNFVDADNWAMIQEKDVALRRSPYFSDARRAFLLDRWPYWDRWVNAPAPGIRSLGYRE